MTDHPDIVERLRVAAIVLDHLPELPGFNGSALTIDDVESARCAKAMFDGAAEITRLRAEAEALRKDAERYRWLLAEHERIDPMAAIVWKWKCERSSSEWVNSASPQSINEHIDTQLRAAIAATKEQQA